MDQKLENKVRSMLSATNGPRFVRADDLRLGDFIAVGSWDGSTRVFSITALCVVGDDVEIEGTDGNSLTTSVGNFIVSLGRDVEFSSV